ncbi:MAG TPA: hypothetical protein VIU11_22945 [Nakamurella sp.]
MQLAVLLGHAERVADSDQRWWRRDLIDPVHTDVVGVAVVLAQQLLMGTGEGVDPDDAAGTALGRDDETPSSIAKPLDTPLLRNPPMEMVD